MPNNEMSPFNGDFYDSSGNLRNLDGGEGSGLESMTPFNGNFIGSDGNVHNIDELSGGGGGVSNYNGLTNKPKINGVELAGGNNAPETLKLIYIYTQNTASAVWTIMHNLNDINVAVQVIDNAGNEVIPDVDFTSANVVTLTFAHAMTGVAKIRK